MFQLSGSTAQANTTKGSLKVHTSAYLQGCTCVCVCTPIYVHKDHFTSRKKIQYFKILQRTCLQGSFTIRSARTRGESSWEICCALKWFLSGSSSLRRKITSGFKDSC